MAPRRAAARPRLIDGLGAGELEDDVGAAAGRLLQAADRVLGPGQLDDGDVAGAAVLGPPAGVGGGEAVDLGDGDARGSGDARDLGAHGADRSVAEDGDRRPGEVGDLRGVDGVAERVEEGADLGRDDPAVERDDVERGHLDVLREAAVAVDAEDPGVLADVAAAGQAGAARAVGDVHLGRDVLADLEMRALAAGTERDDLAAELVAVDARRLDHARHRRVPLVDVLVRAADGGGDDLDQHLGLAGDGNGDGLDLGGGRAGGGFRLDDGGHGGGEPGRGRLAVRAMAGLMRTACRGLAAAPSPSPSPP